MGRQGVIRARSEGYARLLDANEHVREGNEYVYSRPLVLKIM